MKALKRFMRRLLKPQTITLPLEVRRRLRVHRQERACRMTTYAAAWQRKWDAEAVRRNADAQAIRSTYTAVPK